MIVSVQPMMAPVGKIFEVEYMYKVNKPIDFIDISFVNEPYDPDKEKK